MQLNITGHHISITDALRSSVKEKMTKLKRHFDHMTNVHVVLTVDNAKQTAEGILHVSGAEIFANCTKEDMYAAIDGMASKLDKQVIKHKEKLNSHR